MMLVLLEDDNGQKSMHDQAVAHEDCTDLLNQLTKVPEMLTLRDDPTSKGRVIEAFCILPSGSIMKWSANAGE